MLIHLETVVVAVLLAVVLGWMVLLIRSRRRRRLVATLVLVLLIAGTQLALRLRVPPLAEDDITYRPISVQSDGYVSSDTCESCHPRAYATWHGSFHRKMTQVVSDNTVIGDFDDVQLEYHGESYQLSAQDDRFWFASKPLVSVAQVEDKSVRRPIVLSTGSHHMQAYWYPAGLGRTLEFFPFIYLIPEQRWAPRESVFLQPTTAVHVPVEALSEEEEWQRNRQWNYSCLHCHTTNGQPRLAELDTRVGEFGIACESCHGPAEEHVMQNRAPQRRYLKHLGIRREQTIVNPDNLSAERSSQVCGSCHGVTYPRPEEVKNHFRGGRSYRPGDDLNETRVICQDSALVNTMDECPGVESENRFWSDGMVRVSGREYGSLINSPCYQGGEFSCLSCHLMHVEEEDPRPIAAWANDQLKSGMEENRACVQCHSNFESNDALIAHTHHLQQSSGSNCYNCHMPYTAYGLLKATRSHQVDSPTVAASLETGRPNACNQCHLDRSLGWAAENLDAWYGQEQPELTDVQRSVPASIIWLLSGDAGQRALMAWSMGWESARQASGSDWMPQFLTQFLTDPYDAVRLLAHRSLRQHAGFEDFEFDFVGPRPQRQAAINNAAGRLAGLNPGSVIDDPDQRLPADILLRLLQQRDNRVIRLAE
ncbi:MAG: multiheme c-type cytochrome [Thermoanaerobaculia bacterium]